MVAAVITKPATTRGCSMKLFNIREWIGCIVSHSGKWDNPTQEAWVSYSGGTERKFSKKVQFRTCTECNAVEKREVCSGK